VAREISVLTIDPEDVADDPVARLDGEPPDSVWGGGVNGEKGRGFRGRRLLD